MIDFFKMARQPSGPFLLPVDGLLSADPNLSGNPLDAGDLSGLALCR